MDEQFGGAKKKRAVGSRRMVVNGTAHHTVGGLKSSDLKTNGEGRLVSRAASTAGKKQFKNISAFHALVMKIYRSLPKGSASLSKAMKQASREWKSSPKKH